MSIPYAPKFLQPDPDGSLSNSTTPTFKMRYASSRGSADPAGQVQFVGTRVGQAGVPTQTPQNVLLSGWLGAPTTNALPIALRDFGCVQVATGPGQGQLGDAEGRVYVVGGQDAVGVTRSDVYSAPYSGGSIGSWRVERPMVVYPQTGSTSANLAPRYAHGCCVATFGQTGGSGSAGFGRGGVPWIIVYGGFDGVNPTPSNTMLAAPILPDGTLGPWITLAINAGANLAYLQLTPIPSPYITAALMISGGIQTSVGAAVNACFLTLVRNAPASAKSLFDWDTPGGWWIPMATAGAAPGWGGHVVFYDWANQVVMIAKGSDNSGSVQAGFYWTGLAIDVNAWTIAQGSTWTIASSTGSPANLHGGGAVYFMAQQPGAWGNSPHSYLYVVGGSSAVGLADRASSVNSIQIANLTWAASGQPSAVWSNSANALPTATTGLGVVLGDHLAVGAGYPPWPDANLARISALGGATAATAAVTSVRSSSIAVPVAGTSNSAWVSGIGAGLASGDLGTGGVVAASTATDAPAGAQDVTYVYGATGSPLALSAGDVVQLSTQFTDKVGGDPSPFKSSIIRIGNAPTITGLTVSSLTTGQPVISLAWNSGTGGMAEASWRITVTRNSDSVVVFDSGVRIDQQNQVQVVLAPMLTNVLYNVAATVSSLDTPVPGSTDVATASTSFTPTLAAAPSAPTGLTATGDAIGKWMLLNYTTQTGTTAVRIYHRLTSVGGAFTLLVDNLASTVGAQSIKLMDRLEIGTAYDFYVSALGAASAMESAASGIASNVTIPADAASPSAYLHVVGQPLGTALGVSVQMQSWPTMQAIYASKVIPRFNAARPVGRQGVLNYRTLEIEFMSIHGANLSALEAVVDALLAGAVVFYRDRRGTCFPCILNTPEDVQFLYPDHTALKIRLVQVDDLYSPYVTNGSALGIPTLSYGTLPPLRRASLVA